MTASSVVDVHQHLWPTGLIESLRRRSSFPRMDGWTLHLAGEPPYEIDPSDHDIATRKRRNAEDGIEVAVLSLSSPLGLEWLPAAEAEPLMTVWNEGALALGEGFAVWAATAMSELDPEAVGRAFDQGCIGLQIPADAIATVQHVDRLLPLLDVCQSRGKPVLVHPGPARQAEGQLPSWWVPVVDYVSQQHAAWWAWHAAGRSLLPELRICFAAAAGLAPLHHERQVARGGRLSGPDPNVFVDTSSYGPHGLRALIDVLGIDAVVLGSDRPYAEPTDPGLGDAATRDIRHANPHRLLYGEQP